MMISVQLVASPLSYCCEVPEASPEYQILAREALRIFHVENPGRVPVRNVRGLAKIMTLVSQESGINIDEAVLRRYQTEAARIFHMYYEAVRYAYSFERYAYSFEQTAADNFCCALCLINLWFCALVLLWAAVPDVTPFYQLFFALGFEIGLLCYVCNHLIHIIYLALYPQQDPEDSEDPQFLAFQAGSALHKAGRRPIAEEALGELRRIRARNGTPRSEPFRDLPRVIEGLRRSLYADHHPTPNELHAVVVDTP